MGMNGGSKRLAAALWTVLTLAGCSQKNPDETSGDGGAGAFPPWVWQCETPGSGEPGDAGAESYFPVVAGAKWSLYHHGGKTLGDGDTLVPDDDAFENFSVEDAEYQGQPVHLFADSPNRKGKVTKDWVAPDGEAFLRLHEEAFDKADLEHPILAVDYYIGTVKSGVPKIDRYESGFRRFDETWLDRPAGWSELVAFNRKATVDTTGTEAHPGEETVRVYRFTVESVSETVEVPAGTFERCLQVKRERVREPGSNATANERWDDVKRFWFCPGIGKVKEAEVNADPRTEVLLYYCIPGGRCCS